MREKRHIIVFLSVLLILGFAGCARISFFQNYQKAAQHFREDVLNFYDTASDAYFILGYEYYELAKDFEKKGDTQQAAYYRHKATLYYNISKDLKNAAAQTRHFSAEH